MNNAYAVDYNGQTYEQIVGIIRFSTDGTVIQDEVFNNDSVESLTFTSDMRVPYLTASLVYRDRSVEGIQDTLHDGYTHVVVTIKHYSGHNILEEINHTFVVTNVKLVDKEEYLFDFELKSMYWFMFNNFEVYSSIDKNVEYTKMVESLISTIGFSERMDFVEQTTNGGDFISTTNSTLYETIKELLSLSANPEQGFFFLQYDFTTDKYNINSIKSTYNNLRDVDKASNYYILMTDEHKVSTDQASVGRLVSGSEFTFEDYVNAIKDYHSHDFNYDARAWTTKSYNITTVNEFMPPVSDAKIFKHFVKPLPNLYKSRTIFPQESDSNNNDSHLGQLMDLFLYTNYSIITSSGNLYRKAGDLSLIDAMNGSTLKNKYVGLWFIMRVNHTFNGLEKTYTNTFEISRADYLKDLDRVKVVDEYDFAGVGAGSDFSNRA